VLEGQLLDAAQMWQGEVFEGRWRGLLGFWTRGSREYEVEEAHELAVDDESVSGKRFHVFVDAVQHLGEMSLRLLLSRGVGRGKGDVGAGQGDGGGVEGWGCGVSVATRGGGVWGAGVEGDGV